MIERSSSSPRGPARAGRAMRKPPRGSGAGVELQPLGDPEVPGHVSSEGLKHAEIYAQYGLSPAPRSCWQYMHAEGGWIMACFHIVCAIIGAGVLGLPHALSVLGWFGGAVALVAFFAVTLWCSFMLSDMHEYDGVRHGTYGDAVVNILGRGSAAAVTVCQLFNLVLSAIGYTVAAGESLKMVVHSACKAEDPTCGGPIWPFSLAFGAVQLGFSQMPSLESAWWSSAVGAAMSVAYSTIALGLGLGKADPSRLSLAGREMTPWAKVFGVFNALGAVAFAYSFSAVLLEVQDTLHEPPAATVTMRKAVTASLMTTFVAYVGVGFAGYAALGDATPGNILTGFTHPPGLVRAANAMVLVHMVPAYQVFSQPVFHMVEGALAAKHPAVKPGRRWHTPMRLALRSLYVVGTTVVACSMPFFSDIIGLIGAIVFWPSTVYFPIAMYTRVHSPPPMQRALMRTTNVACLLVSLLGAAGSLYNIAKAAGSYRMFGT